MSKCFRIKYSFLVPLFLFLIIIIASGNERSQALEKDYSPSLQHMDAQVLNEYIATMIKNKEPEIKAAVLNGGELTDIKLNDTDFDIMTGKILIGFSVEYQKKDIKGALGFEVRVSNDRSQRVGGSCSGLEGGLHSNDILTDIMLVLTKNSINKSLAGKQFWSDSQNHNEYLVFKNDNLTTIINRALIESGAANEQFRQITRSVPGGTLQAVFKNLSCRSFDLGTGQAVISADISASMKSDFGKTFKFDNAGSVEAGFDFNISRDDQSWWAKLNQFKLRINLLTPGMNEMIQDAINKELNTRQVLFPIDMPKSN